MACGHTCGYPGQLLFFSFLVPRGPLLRKIVQCLGVYWAALNQDGGLCS